VLHAVHAGSISPAAGEIIALALIRFNVAAVACLHKQVAEPKLARVPCAPPLAYGVTDNC
jgi:hypothetical protein